MNSFITTDLRAWYLIHEFDSSDDPLSDGQIDGDVTVAALQVRVALTQSLDPEVLRAHRGARTDSRVDSNRVAGAFYDTLRTEKATT